MKHRKIMLGATALLSVSMLTACQNNKPKSNAKFNVSKVSQTKKSVPKKMGTLTADDLSAKENVSVITAYAGKKFHGEWGRVLTKAENSKLEVAFDQRSQHPAIAKGEGYVYAVSADGNSSRTYYTLNGDGEDQLIYIYQGEKLLGQSTVKHMVDYLNKLNCDSLVKKLTQNAVVGGQSDDSEDSSSSDSSKPAKKSDLPGDAGIFTVPAKYHGTWYGYPYDSDDMQTITITEHTLTQNGTRIELHKQKKNFDHDKNARMYEKVQKYAVASFTNNVDNLGVGISTYGWVQGAGASDLFFVNSEDGQPTLISTNGTGGYLTVLWKSKALAEKNKDKHFDDLKQFDRATQDDDDSDDE